MFINLKGRKKKMKKMMMMQNEKKGKKRRNGKISSSSSSSSSSRLSHLPDQDGIPVSCYIEMSPLTQHTSTSSSSTSSLLEVGEHVDEEDEVEMMMGSMEDLYVVTIRLAAIVGRIRTGNISYEVISSSSHPHLIVIL